MKIRAPPSLCWMAVGCVAVFTAVRYLRAIHALDRQPQGDQDEEEEAQRVATSDADAVSEDAHPLVAEVEEETQTPVDDATEDAEPTAATTPVEEEVVADATEADAAKPAAVEAPASATTTTTVAATTTTPMAPAPTAELEVVESLPVAQDPAPIDPTPTLAMTEPVASESTDVMTPAAVDNKPEPIVSTVSTPAAPAPPRPKRVCYVVMGDTSKCSDLELWAKRRFILQELGNMHVPATELVLNDEVHWALTAKYKLHSGGSTQYPQIFLEYEGDDTNVRFIPHERFEKIVYHSGLTPKQLDDAKILKKFRVDNTFRDVPKRPAGIFHAAPRPTGNTTAVQQAVEIKLELRLRAKLTADAKAQAAKAAEEADQKKKKKKKAEKEKAAAYRQEEEEEKAQEATTEAAADHIEAEELEVFDILDVD